MRCSEFPNWAIAVSLMACTSEPVRAAAGFGPGEMGTGSGGEEAGSSAPNDASIVSKDSSAGSGGSGAAPVDAAKDSPGFIPPDVKIFQGETGVALCPMDRAAVGSSTLLAA